MSSTDEEQRKLIVSDIVQANVAMAQDILLLQRKLEAVIVEREAVIVERDELKRLLEKAHMRYETLVRDELKPLQAQVEELQRQLCLKENEIKGLRATIHDLQATIAEHKATIAEHKATIAEHKATIAEHKVTIAEHKATIAEHKVTIAELKGAHTEQQAFNSAMEDSVEQMRVDHHEFRLEMNRRLSEAKTDATKHRNRGDNAEQKVQDLEVKLALLSAASYAQFVKHQLVFSVVTASEREDWQQFVHETLESVMDKGGDVDEAKRALQIAIEEYWSQTTHTPLRALYQACRCVQKPRNVVAHPFVVYDTLNDAKNVLVAAEETTVVSGFQALMKYGKYLWGETQSTAMVDFNDRMAKKRHH